MTLKPKGKMGNQRWAMRIGGMEADRQRDREGTHGVRGRCVCETVCVCACSPVQGFGRVMDYLFSATHFLINPLPQPGSGERQRERERKRERERERGRGWEGVIERKRQRNKENLCDKGRQREME